MQRKIVGSSPHIWKPDWWEHIAEEPIYINSKKKLREECKKRGVFAPGYM